MRCLTALCLSATMLVGIAGLSESASAQAADSFPNKPIKVVIPFAAGGGNDVLARVVGTKAVELLGQPIVIENRPGAGGRVAAEYVLNQPKDGYTVFVGASGGMSIAAAIYPNLPYHPTKDFIPLTVIADYPLVVSVNPKLPINSVKELVEYANAHPDIANYPASGAAFVIASELLKLESGMRAQRIMYKSSNEMVMSVIQGISMFSISDPSPAMPQVQSGTLRALAVTAKERSPEMPNIPSMTEAGFPNVNLRFFSGYFVAAGTPAPIAEKLETAFRTAISDKAVAERIRQLGGTPGGNSSADFRASLDKDIALVSRIVKDANLKFEN